MTPDDQNLLRSMINSGVSFAGTFRLLALLAGACWATTLAWPDWPVDSPKAGGKGRGSIGST